MAKKKVKPSTLETIDLFVKTTKTIIGALFTLIIGIFFLVIIISLLMPSVEFLEGNTALIPIKGTITTQKTGGLLTEAPPSQKIVNWIQKADEDKEIKAIVIEIDSPGGSPVASYEIAQAIKKAEKPTIALIREKGASGGFWIATAADTIFANPMSITGSIGVIGSYIEFAGLIEQYNMTYRRLIAGEHKDALNRFKELTPTEQQMFQQKLNKLHDYFITAVAENRNLAKETVKKDADGFIMLGIEAKQKGYIDLLGGREEVKQYLNQTLNIKEPKFREYKATPGFFDIIGASANQFGYYLGRGISSNMEEEIELRVQN